MRGKPAGGSGRAAGPQVGLGSLLSVPSLTATQGRLPVRAAWTNLSAALQSLSKSLLTGAPHGWAALQPRRDPLPVIHSLPARAFLDF